MFVSGIRKTELSEGGRWMFVRCKRRQTDSFGGGLNVGESHRGMGG